MGIAFDNSFAWVIADLACQQANVCCVPVPLFFSASQQEHVLNESQCHFLLTNRGGELSEWSEYNMFVNAALKKMVLYIISASDPSTMVVGRIHRCYSGWSSCYYRLHVETDRNPSSILQCQLSLTISSRTK